MNEIVTQIKNENSKFVKWLTSSARPILIFSTSLKYWIKFDHSIVELEIICFFKIQWSQVRYILHNANRKIGFTPRNIEPSDFLPHQRFKIFDSNTSYLPNSGSIEAIYTKYAKYKLPKSGYGSQNSISNRIIYNFSSILFNRGVCSTKFNQWPISKIRNEIELICILYNILPPPNHLSINVGELVPIPYVRSTKSDVNSPYTIIIHDIARAFNNVKITPRNITNKSHRVAYRYWNVTHKKTKINLKFQCNLLNLLSMPRTKFK